MCQPTYKSCLAVALMLLAVMVMPVGVEAQGQITISARPSNPTPVKDEIVVVPIIVDMSGTDLRLGCIATSLQWEPTQLTFVDFAPGTTEGFAGPEVNTLKATEGKLLFASINARGAAGPVNVLSIRLRAKIDIHAWQGLRVEVTTLAAAESFIDLSKQMNTLPASWAFTSNTGPNATIAIPAAINPVIGDNPLQTGDAIGVFFQSGSTLLCAGYGLWQSGQNLALTAWGDNPQTTVKDGFAEGELIRYKIWEAAAQKEYDAQVTYRTGSTTFTNNGIYELSSLRAVTNVSHSNALAQGWNMISSYVEPNPANLETVLADVIPKMVIMKNGRGQVFWPSLGINQIGAWNPREGYQIFMQSATPLTVTGTQIVPQATPIVLSQGWNLASYLRNSLMNIDAALTSLGNKLVIAKNNAGQVYWPALGINQIRAMTPGQGYLLFLSEAATLTYPANSSAPAGAEDASLAKMSTSAPAMRMESPRHYSAITSNTGANATVLIESPEFIEGDEIAVQTESGKLVGSALIKRGKALLTIWGDDDLSKDRVEGAVAGEMLSLKIWSVNEQKEKAVVVTTLENALTRETVSGGWRYQANAVWKAQVTEAIAIPGTFSLAQNYPNPFNPSTAIKYGLPHDAKVTLEVFDTLGRRVAVLVDASQPAGYYEVIFQNPTLPSGLYFYRLQAGTFMQTNKMVILR